MADTEEKPAHIQEVDEEHSKGETTDETPTTGDEGKKPTEEGEGEGKGEGEGSSSGGSSKSRENTDSIPTAGGERLGEKHWGESKIVPEVPPQPQDKGVSSEDGQPDDETKANTAKNAGDGDKPSLMDKVKDKLNMGGKSA